MSQGRADQGPGAARLPLDGQLVLALANDVGALFAGALLADHGARAILLEDPAGGCRLRAADPPVGGSSSLYFECEARGLESVVLDLRSEEGRCHARRLAGLADILIEDLGKGALERVGLGPDVLLAANPRLVVARLSPYGQTGPLAEAPGDDRTAQAFSGAAFTTGFTTDEPRPHAFPLAQYWSGISLANGALLAALHARRSGVGQVVDLALYETLFRCQEEMIGQLDQLGTIRVRMGNEYPEAAPISCYPSADGRWVFCSAANDASFAALCRAMGRSEWTTDERFATPSARIANREVLDRLIEAWTLTQPMPELIARLRAAGAAFAAVRQMSEILDDPHVRAREALAIVRPRGSGMEIPVPNVVPRLHESGRRALAPAPRLGEHTESVLGWSATSGSPARAATGTPASNGPVAAGPLGGRRVIDLGRFIAAPVTAAMLGEFGADVIRIELPGGAAGTHRRAPVKDGVSLSNAMYQRSKRQMTLDLRTGAGREILLDLVKQSDVLIENFRPGTLEGWGLGPAELRRARPDLILVRLSGFGQTGPDAMLSAFDPVALAGGGGVALLGGTRLRPLRPGVLMGDYTGALMAVFGTLVALFAREVHGRGEVVDLALYEAILRMMSDAPARYAVDGSCRADRDDPWVGAPACVVVRSTDDRYVVVSGADEDRLARVTGGPGPAALRAWAAARTAESAVAGLREARVAAAVIFDPRDLIAHPQIAARGNVVTVRHHTLGDVRQQASVPRLDLTPGVVSSEAPYGAHTAAILGGLLGYSAQRIEQLASAGTI